MTELPGQQDQADGLRELNDPEFFTRWAAARGHLFSTPADKPEHREIKHLYDALSAEYRRRTGGLAATNVDY